MRSVLDLNCEYYHLTLCRVASVGLLDMIASQQPTFNAAEIDNVKSLFEIVLNTMRSKGYMARTTATSRRSQYVNIYHRANWNKFGVVEDPLFV